MKKYNQKVAISATSIALVVTTIISGWMLKLSKEQKYDAMITTTTSKSTEVNTEQNYDTDDFKLDKNEDGKLEVTRINETTETTKAVETTKPVETTKSVEPTTKAQKDNKVDEYRLAIKNRVDKVCKQNGYSELTQKRLNEMFYEIEENYDDFAEVNKNSGLPEREVFIEGLIRHLETDNVKINVFKENEKYEKTLRDAGAEGLYLPADNMVLVLDADSDITPEVLFEEIIHSTQKKQSYNSFELVFLDYKVLRTVLSEGEPGFYRCLFADGINYDYCDSKSEGSLYYTANSIKMDNAAVQSKNYSILNHLAGYEAMQEFKETNDLNTIKKAIDKNYDVDTNKLFNLMNISYDKLTINDRCNLENMFCDCLKQDIERIDSKSSAIDTLNNYRFYRLQFGANCYTKEGVELKEDLTNTMIKYGEVESLLKSKVKDYDALNVENSDEMIDVLCGKATSVYKCMNIYDFNCYEDDNAIYVQAPGTDVTVHNLNTKENDFVPSISKNLTKLVDSGSSKTL